MKRLIALILALMLLLISCDTIPVENSTTDTSEESLSVETTHTTLEGTDSEESENNSTEKDTSDSSTTGISETDGNYTTESPTDGLSTEGGITEGDTAGDTTETDTTESDTTETHTVEVTTDEITTEKPSNDETVGDQDQTDDPSTNEDTTEQDSTAEDTTVEDTTVEDTTVEDTTETADATCDHEWTNADCLLPSTCHKCGSTNGTALGHDKQYHSAQSATCTNIGWEAYETCSRCNYSTYSEIGLIDHVEVIDAAVEATCTASGLTQGKHCFVCNTILVASHPTSPKGHAYDNDLDANCNTCGFERDVACHHPTKTTIPAIDATCTSTGLTEGQKCANPECEQIIVAQTVIPAKGHTEVTITGKAATCTESGLTDGKKCSVCQTVTVSQTTIPAKGHTEVTITGKAATCTESGLTDGKKCSVCQTVTVSQTTISAKGHTWTAATTAAPKTCQTCGTTEGDKLPSSSASAETLYVYYIDVGQGDSIFIKVGDCDILIDAGTSGNGSNVSSFLKSKNVDDIELMINSHPDADHYGGLVQVLKDYTVETVWISAFSKTTTFKTAVTNKGMTPKTPAVGTVYTYDYLTLTVLYSGAGAANSNDSSIVLMLEYGSFRFLFTGDISSTIESKLVSSGKDLSCDVLKVAHHGSAGSSSKDFLEATGAQYGVICVGSNSYGHPTSAALNNLSAAGIVTYRTDTSGTITFSTNGAKLTLPNGSTDTSGSGSGVISGGSSSGGSSSGGSSSGGSSSGGSGTYIANANTKTYHVSTCSYLPSAANREYITDTTGYKPCTRCITTYIANKNTKTYHVSTCSSLPSEANQIIIVDTTGYTACSKCIKSSSGSSGSTKTYIANAETKVYHLATCPNLPDASKQIVIISTSGYTACGRCIGKSGANTTVQTQDKALRYSAVIYIPSESKQRLILPRAV